MKFALSNADTTTIRRLTLSIIEKVRDKKNATPFEAAFFQSFNRSSFNPYFPFPG